MTNEFRDYDEIYAGKVNNFQEKPKRLFSFINYRYLLYYQVLNMIIHVYYDESYRGKSPITDTLLIPTPSRISVTIRDIKK